MSNPIVRMEHPLGARSRAEVQDNLQNARKWLQYLLRHFPDFDFTAEWILWGELLDDHIPEERARGIAFGVEMARRCDEIWLVGGRVSEGMKRAWEMAQQNNKRVVDLTFLGRDIPIALWGQRAAVLDAVGPDRNPQLVEGQVRVGR
jgi:hypothetical protein